MVQALAALRQGAVSALLRAGARGAPPARGLGWRGLASSSAAQEDPTVDPPSPPGATAFTANELPAVMDLFATFATVQGANGRELDLEGLERLLNSIGEDTDPRTVRKVFREADSDANGTIDLSEFLAASDRVLGEKPARVVLVVGGPGSGKGMLSERLVQECGVSHVSCGDLLREEVRLQTPLGRECQEVMLRGGLISSATVVRLLRRRMRQFPGRRLLLDGFPRSKQNAMDFADSCGMPELALHITCPEEVMVERILRRAEYEGREDDTHEIALKRIQTFREQGEPTMQWLRESKVPIIELDGSGHPDVVRARHAL